MAPCRELFVCQPDICEGLGYGASSAFLLGFRHNPGDGDTVSLQNEGHALVMGTVHAVGEVAGCLGDGDDLLAHKIRLSYFMVSGLGRDRLHFAALVVLLGMSPF